MASSTPSTRKLSFPILQRIRLKHFSLYSLANTIEFTFDAGIVCLAGANGLGKSTFLQTVGYGMTGVVPKPDQKFVSVDDYYRDVRTFTRDYFDGRILPEHMDIAEIELEINRSGRIRTYRRSDSCHG
jgi:DNA repair exonuclease SbcCD ATPase subunit